MGLQTYMQVRRPEISAGARALFALLPDRKRGVSSDPKID